MAQTLPQGVLGGGGGGVQGLLDRPAGGRDVLTHPVSAWRSVTLLCHFLFDGCGRGFCWTRPLVNNTTKLLWRLKRDKMADNVSLAMGMLQDDPPKLTTKPKLLLTTLTISLRPGPRRAAVLHFDGWSHWLSGGGGGGRGLRETESHL